MLNNPNPPAMSVAELWRSSDSQAWKSALEGYWAFVQPRNVDLERSLSKLDIQRIHNLTPEGWYSFLQDEYFRWKYTAPNRYATTTIQLRKYLDKNELEELDCIRQELLDLNVEDIRGGLMTAKKIRGLGTAGASGLLSLIYPDRFATVDQFVVKALVLVPDLPEASAIAAMNPENLSIRNGALLIDILTRKAQQNNQLFGTSEWTPRKIDMVLWTYGR